jgi:DNA-binding transcriptional LysR family regulator
MLNLRKLQTFRVVADTRNFTRAAAQLGCCQSSVTTHIQALERELGVLLFDRCRISKTVVLTKHGRHVLEYADRLLALADETKAAVHSAATPLGNHGTVADQWNLFPPRSSSEL